MLFKENYTKNILPKLYKDLGIKNVMQTPKFEKIVLNIGIGSYLAGSGSKDFSSLKNDLALITGQQPQVMYARKAISNFKLRK